MAFSLNEMHSIKAAEHLILEKRRVEMNRPNVSVEKKRHFIHARRSSDTNLLSLTGSTHTYTHTSLSLLPLRAWEITLRAKEGNRPPTALPGSCVGGPKLQ